MSTILYPFAKGTSCDHGEALVGEDCIHCVVAERILAYRPRAIRPDTLGSCDSCGQDQPLSGHLYKQFDGSYSCPDCDELVKIKDYCND